MTNDDPHDPGHAPLAADEKLSLLVQAIADGDGGFNHREFTASSELDAWQITYLDTITLVLSLLAFMMSLMQMPQPQREAITNAIQSKIQYPGLVGFPDILVRVKDVEAIGNVGGLLRVVKENGLESAVKVSITKNQATMVIGDSLLFSSGSAALSANGNSLLRSFGPALNELNGRITVEGHTDNSPVETGAFGSNWELSASRATTVVRLLTSLGIPESRFRVIAYGDTSPIADNTTPEGRAQNRRVTISVDISAAEQGR